MNGWTYVKYGFSLLTSISKAIWSRRRSRVDGDNDDYAHLLDFVHERVVAHFVVVHCTLFFYDPPKQATNACSKLMLYKRRNVMQQSI